MGTGSQTCGKRKLHRELNDIIVIKRGDLTEQKNFAQVEFHESGIIRKITPFQEIADNREWEHVSEEIFVAKRARDAIGASDDLRREVENEPE